MEAHQINELSNPKIPETPKEGGKLTYNSGSTESRVDKFSGQHTTSIIIAILFLVIFIAFVVIICIKDKVDSDIKTGIFALLSGLIGYFTGTLPKKS